MACKKCPTLPGFFNSGVIRKLTMADKNYGGGLRERRFGVGGARFVRNRPCLQPEPAYNENAVASALVLMGDNHDRNAVRMVVQSG